MSMPLTTPFGTHDEGVAFGVLIVVVFLFVILVEYVRTKRAKEGSLRREQYATAAVWGVMLTMAAAGYVVAPNVALRHDISILLTVGAALQLLGFGLLWLAPRRCPDKSLPRAPADFALLMAFALSLRVVVELKWNGYLPVDRTGDGCIQVMEVLALYFTVHGLGTIHVQRSELRRALCLGVGCVLFGQACFGDLDVNPVPDKAFAISIYCELLAWGCMARYVFGRGKDAINSSCLPPAFVQAMCRGYFWYVALPETRVRVPLHWVQAQFNYVLVAAHVGMALLALAMSAQAVREFKPAMAPHELLNPDSAFMV